MSFRKTGRSRPKVCEQRLVGSNCSHAWCLRNQGGGPHDRYNIHFNKCANITTMKTLSPTPLKPFATGRHARTRISSRGGTPTPSICCVTRFASSNSAGLYRLAETASRIPTRLGRRARRMRPLSISALSYQTSDPDPIHGQPCRAAWKYHGITLSIRHGVSLRPEDLQQGTAPLALVHAIKLQRRASVWNVSSSGQA